MKEFKTIGYLAGVTTIVYLLFFGLQPERFGSLNSLFILLQQSFLSSISACGLYFIVCMGLFDFSVGGNIVLSGIIAALFSLNLGYFGLVLGGVLTGLLVGLVNGIVYSKLKLPSIIVTVGLVMVYECLAMFISGGTILRLDNDMMLLGKPPYDIVVSILLFAFAYLLLKYTRVGIYSRAIGSNEKLAKSMGINIGRYKLIAFVLCGLFVGVASILTISYSSSIKPLLNLSSMNRVFTPLMGTFVGIGLRKYVNPVIAIIFGGFILSLIMNGLMTNGIPANLQNVVVGITLLLIIGLTSISKKNTLLT